MMVRVSSRARARVQAHLAAAEDEVRDEHGRREAGHGAPRDECAAVAQALGHRGGALAAHAVGCGVRALPACVSLARAGTDARARGRVEAMIRTRLFVKIVGHG